jgi:oligoendopeptidase F
MEVPLAELRRINDAYYASLGADPRALGIHYDIAPRAGRGPVPVAFMLDVDIPRRTAEGWTPGDQWVFASYGRPRLPDLGELLHETGHAVHSRAIRTRPAFAVLREAMTTLIEALGDLVAWDLYEPGWQARHLGLAVPLETGLRAKYGDVVRDVAWSLFEIELHRTPERAPNDAWTEIAERYLGVRAHPEWSWWAIRGQLVQSPGYMVNYGLGAIVTADLRARLRELRGDWLGGDPGWYEATSEAIYRWGGEREPSEVLEAFLGRPVRPDAILADLRRLAERPA